MNSLFKKIAAIAGAEDMEAVSGSDLVLSESEAIDIKLLALELLLPENTKNQSDGENIEAVHWICWADWIISGDFKHVRLSDYRVPWLYANFQDARLGVCLPLKPLMGLQEFLAGSEWPASGPTGKRAFLKKARIGTTWKLASIKGRPRQNA